MSLELMSRQFLLDGASVNIAEQNGMKGTMQRALPWLFWSWCYAHRLELACKDALSSQLFKNVTEMLLRVYHLYEKSPKKCRELTDFISDLKEVLEFPESGDLPVRSQGSRWITHKCKALQRVIDRYSAYLHHLNSLIEDRTVKAEDRARIKGYSQKWSQGRILIGCALYIVETRFFRFKIYCCRFHIFRIPFQTGILQKLPVYYN